MLFRTVLVFVFATAAALAASETDASLENSAKELKKLKQDQAHRDDSAGKVDLGPGVSDFHAPVNETVPLDRPTPAGKSLADLKKKKEQQKNWLVDGVAKLEREEKAKDGGSAETPAPAAAAEAGRENSPAAGPNADLLAVYGDQLKGQAGGKGASKPVPASAHDAFAPFMQQWLESSPARGKFFDEFVQRPEANAGPAATASPPASGISSSLPADAWAAPRDLKPPPAANPYLSGLTLPSPTESSPARAAAVDFGGLGQTLAPVAPVGPDAAAPAVAPEPKRPPASPADDKKYFPQLKKF